MSQSISAATEEQTTNAKQVSKAIENVNELTQQAASAAEQMSATTEELATLAQKLRQQVEQFKLLDDGEQHALPRTAEHAAGRRRLTPAMMAEATAVSPKKGKNGFAA